MHAARGALWDSIAHHLTLANLSMIAVVASDRRRDTRLATHLPIAAPSRDWSVPADRPRDSGPGPQAASTRLASIAMP